LWDTQFKATEIFYGEEDALIDRESTDNSQRKRKNYTPLGIDSGDIIRGYELKPGREGVRRRQARKNYENGLVECVDGEEATRALEMGFRTEIRKYRNSRRDHAQDSVDEKKTRYEMEEAEKWMRTMNALIEEERLRKEAEMEREAQELKWMRFEEEHQRWVEAEIKRIEDEERKRLEEEKRRREAEAKMSKRVARRGRVSESRHCILHSRMLYTRMLYTRMLHSHCAERTKSNCTIHDFFRRFH
jgi:hypothetical protein